jgi:hypothetical protein
VQAKPGWGIIPKPSPRVTASKFAYRDSVESKVGSDFGEDDVRSPILIAKPIGGK